MEKSNRFNIKLKRIKLNNSRFQGDLNSYVKLVKGSNGQALPTRYSICEAFDEEIERKTITKNQNYSPDMAEDGNEQHQAITTATTAVGKIHINSNNAHTKLLTALHVLKQKDKFKSRSLINAAATAAAAAVTSTHPSLTTITSSTASTASYTTLNNERGSIDAIERQINQNLRQLEQAKIDSSKQRRPNSSATAQQQRLLLGIDSQQQQLHSANSVSTSTTTASSSDTDNYRSLITEEVNPSALYRYRKLRTTVSDLNLLRPPPVNVSSTSVHQQQQSVVHKEKHTRVMCTTLTLNDTVMPQMPSFAAASFNSFREMIISNSSSVVNTPSSTRVRSSTLNRHIMPLSMRHASMNNLLSGQDAAAVAGANGSNGDMVVIPSELNMKSLLAASKPTFSTSSMDQQSGSVATEHVSQAGQSRELKTTAGGLSQNSVGLNNYLKVKMHFSSYNL
jgi:hypothetical protein